MKSLKKLKDLFNFVKGKESVYMVVYPVLTGGFFDPEMNLMVDNPEYAWHHLRWKDDYHFFNHGELSEAKELASESHTVVLKLKQEQLYYGPYACNPKVVADYRNSKFPLDVDALNKELAESEEDERMYWKELSAMETY